LRARVRFSAQQDTLLSLLASPSVFLAFIGATVAVAVQLVRLELGQGGIHKELTGVKDDVKGVKEELKKELLGVKEDVKELKEELKKELKEELKGVTEELKEELKKLSGVLAGVQRQGRSLARGIREVPPGG
jgi:sensor domain CHASE-containing protein